MGFFTNQGNKNSSEKINEFVVNKYSENSDLETTISFKDEIRNGLENRFINPLVKN